MRRCRKDKIQYIFLIDPPKGRWPATQWNEPPATAANITRGVAIVLCGRDLRPALHKDLPPAMR